MRRETTLQELGGWHEAPHTLGSGLGPLMLLSVRLHSLYAKAKQRGEREWHGCTTVECESLGSRPGVSNAWEYERAMRCRKDSPARRSAPDKHAHVRSSADTRACTRNIRIAVLVHGRSVEGFELNPAIRNSNVAPYKLAPHRTWFPQPRRPDALCELANFALGHARRGRAGCPSERPG